MGAIASPLAKTLRAAGRTLKGMPFGMHATFAALRAFPEAIGDAASEHRNARSKENQHCKNGANDPPAAAIAARGARFRFFTGILDPGDAFDHRRGSGFDA